VPIRIALTTPISGPSTPDLEVCHLELHRGINYVGPVRQLDKTASYIKIQLVGQNGVGTPFFYTGTEADDLIVGLNKAALNIKDMHTRIMEKLIADGRLAGTITGSPD
jgi:hypothetical protein